MLVSPFRDALGSLPHCTVGFGVYRHSCGVRLFGFGLITVRLEADLLVRADALVVDVVRPAAAEYPGCLLMPAIRPGGHDNAPSLELLLIIARLFFRNPQSNETAENATRNGTGCRTGDHCRQYASGQDRSNTRKQHRGGRGEETSHNAAGHQALGGSFTSLVTLLTTLCPGVAVTFITHSNAELVLLETCPPELFFGTLRLSALGEDADDNGVHVIRGMRSSRVRYAA